MGVIHGSVSCWHGLYSVFENHIEEIKGVSLYFDEDNRVEITEPEDLAQFYTAMDSISLTRASAKNRTAVGGTYLAMDHFVSVSAWNEKYSDTAGFYVYKDGKALRGAGNLFLVRNMDDTTLFQLFKP